MFMEGTVVIMNIKMYSTLFAPMQRCLLLVIKLKPLARYITCKYDIGQKIFKYSNSVHVAEFICHYIEYVTRWITYLIYLSIPV